MSLQKPIRLRKTAPLRNLVRETRLSVDDIIRPIFVTHFNKQLEIETMPGQFYFPLNEIEKTIDASMKLGINGVLLFGIPEIRDDLGTDTINENGIIQQAVRKIKQSFPELIIITDVCFCQYTTHGHCGILNKFGNIPLTLVREAIATSLPLVEEVGSPADIETVWQAIGCFSPSK